MIVSVEYVIIPLAFSPSVTASPSETAASASLVARNGVRVMPDSPAAHAAASASAPPIAPPTPASSGAPVAAAIAKTRKRAPSPNWRAISTITIAASDWVGSSGAR